MMINNNVGFHTGHITTKANVIADLLSRITCEANISHEFNSILQEFPELGGCKRFHPSASLISHIMDAISQMKYIDPLAVNSSILTNPGQIIS